MIVQFTQNKICNNICGWMEPTQSINKAKPRIKCLSIQHMTGNETNSCISILNKGWLEPTQSFKSANINNT